MDRFDVEAQELVGAMPDLSIISKDGTDILSGEFKLIDNTGVLVDSYAIEIHRSPDYPASFPFIFETGGRLPKNMDWHVYEGMGNCCLKSPPEEVLICRKGISLISFMENEVKPYFFNQTHRRKHGYFLRERSHGLKGVFEFYDDILETQGDVRKAISLMAFIAKNEKPGRTFDCFCGSGLKFRKCHRQAFESLSLVGRNVLKQDAGSFALFHRFIDMYPLIQNM